MNRALSLLLLKLLVVCTAYGQYRPMLAEGSEWYHYYFFEASCNHHLVVNGDTTLNNIQYKKIVNKGNLCNFERYTLVREDTSTRQVFYNYGGMQEILIYDFSMQVGDTIRSIFPSYQFELVLDSITNTVPSENACDHPPELFLEEARVFHLSSTDCPSCWSAVWVEGIGNISNPFQPAFSWNGGNLGDALLCHFDPSGFRDYHYVFCEEPEPCLGPVVNTFNLLDNASFSLYPNPAEDEVFLEMVGEALKINQVQIYNSRGQLLGVETLRPYGSIKLNKYPSGLIILLFQSNEGKMWSQKMIKN